MISGETAAVTPFDHALDGLATSLDHVIKLAGDGGLEVYEDPGLIAVMQQVEQFRNRLPLVDHQIVAEIQRRDLATSLCQGSVRRVLTSTLLISKGEASRRVRAAAVVGPRTSPLGQPLPVLRPHLAAAQAEGAVSAEKVAIIERAIGKVDRPGFDADDVDAGEQLLTEQATMLTPDELKISADRVVDAIARTAPCPTSSSTSTAGTWSCGPPATAPGPGSSDSPERPARSSKPCSTR